MKKWVLLVIILMFPATAGGSFIPFNDVATMQRYYPDKIAFPVLPRTLYKVPNKQFTIFGQTLCITDHDSAKVDYLDTRTGKQTSKPEGFDYLPRSYRFYAKKTEMVITGDPPLMIATRNSLVIDRQYYLRFTEEKTSKGSYTYAAVLYDNGKELLRFHTDSVISSVKKVNPDLIVAYEYSKVYVIDLKNLEVNNYSFFWDQQLDKYGTGQVRIKDEFILAGCRIINIKEKKVTAQYVGNSAVFYKDYVVYALNTYGNISLSTIVVSTRDGKVLNKWESEVLDLHFFGSFGDFAYGLSDDLYSYTKKYLDVIKIPSMKMVAKIPVGSGRIIGDDGQNIIYYSDEKIICVNAATGDQVWVNSDFGAIFNEIQYTQCVNGKYFSFEKSRIDHSNPKVTIKKVDGTDNKTVFSGVPMINYGYLSYHTTNIIAFEDGFIISPSFDQTGSIKIYDHDLKLVREIVIDELMSEKYQYHLYAFGKLFVDCGGYSLYEINVKDGTYTKTVLVDKILKDNIPYSFTLIDDKHIVALTCQQTVKVFERKGMKLVWEFPSKNIEALNKNLIIGNDQVYLIDSKKIIDISKYENHDYYYCWETTQ